MCCSVPGADPEHPHPFLRAKGLAEEAVRLGTRVRDRAGTHVYGLGGLVVHRLVKGAARPRRRSSAGPAPRWWRPCTRTMSAR